MIKDTELPPLPMGEAMTHVIVDGPDGNDIVVKLRRPLFTPHQVRTIQREAFAAGIAASKWLPIATAPKDGTQIMLTNGIAVAQGWWEHEEPYVRERRDMEGNYVDQDEHDGFDGWLDCDGGMQPDPTHWQPLPAPPAIIAASQGE